MKGWTDMKRLLFLMVATAIIATGYNATAQKDAQPKIDPATGKPQLTDMQEYVTKHNGTEPAFMNEYWNNKEPGIYVDVISGKPLFSSTDKFDSGSGWPSFTKPLYEEEIKEVEDTSHGMVRTEVRSESGDAHLGHVFPDGPPESGGMRYCINSAALRFIHKDDLEAEGYGEYLHLFDAD